jgi:hypothetical protein
LENVVTGAKIYQRSRLWGYGLDGQTNLGLAKFCEYHDDISSSMTAGNRNNYEDVHQEFDPCNWT